MMVPPWFLVTALTNLFHGAASVPACCPSKTVGGILYYLTSQMDTSSYNCLTDCVYTRSGEEGLQEYCFAAGHEEVECNDEGGCAYNGSYVPNGWTKLVDGKPLVCTDGKIEIFEFEASSPLNATLPAKEMSMLQKLLKRDKVCTKIASLGKSVKGLSELIGKEYEGELKREISKIVEKNKDHDYVCGLESTVNLLENAKLKHVIVERINGILLENNHTGISPTENVNFRNGSKSHRVVQGISAVAGQFPWQARLEFTTCDGDFLCGGVLISPCYVLTARHCADEWETNVRDDFTVILGDLLRTGVQTNEQRFGVHFVHFHPNTKYDIALLLLDRSPTQSNVISPIRLSNTYPGIGERATVSGWGRFSSFSGASSNSLLWREIDLPTFWWCHQYVQNNLGNYKTSLSYDELCGGDLTSHFPYAGACHGDSGGPLARKNPNDGQWELLGIVKRGVPGCPARFDHAIYTSVVFGPIRWWINSILDKSTNPGFGGNCRCNARGTKFDNALQNAWWDGANCQLEFAPVGCGGNAGEAGRQFVWGNRFYIKPNKAVNCPLGSYNGYCHCRIGAIPSGGSVSGVCPNPSWGSGNIFWPGGISAPPETCALEWAGNRYTTPQGTGSPAHCPKGYFDGANCNYYKAVPVDSHAFLWPSNPASNRYYYYGYPAQTHKCIPCFPATSNVMLADGTTKTMEDVVLGDWLLAMSSDGKPTFSKFIGWLHKDQNQHQMFLKIFTAKGSIKVSSHHLILRKSPERNANAHFGFAKDVNPGDYIYMTPQNNTGFTWEKVTSIKSWFGRGIYAPLTEEGTVVVDSTVASCYAEVESHLLAHVALSPVRIFPYLLDDQDSQHLPGFRTFPKSLISVANSFWLTRNYLQLEKEELDGMVNNGDGVIFLVFSFLFYKK